MIGERPKQKTLGQSNSRVWRSSESHRDQLYLEIRVRTKITAIPICGEGEGALLGFSHPHLFVDKVITNTYVPSSFPLASSSGCNNDVLSDRHSKS
jgi:hypothetical protein